MPLPVMPIFLIVNAACDINFDYFWANATIVMPKFNWAMLPVMSILIISVQMPLFVHIPLLLLWNVW
jgi:hypothetical protein